MKKRRIVLLCGFLLIGCTIKGSENPSSTTYITEEMRANAKRSIWQALSTKSLEPAALYDMASDIAIVRVLSVDHADMSYAGFIPMTYGTMLVEIPFLGSLHAGDTIHYVKPGGLVSISEYEQSDDPASIAKRDALRKHIGLEIDKDKTYYDILLGNDVEVIAGKTYLAYFDYHENNGLYEVIGLGNGFRELDVPLKENATIDQPLDISSLHIMNNDTKEAESLAEYLKENIPNNQ